MFRKQFMDELFQKNVSDVRREVAQRERAELQSMPECSTERLEQRLENCRMLSTNKKGLTNGLRDHIEYTRGRLDHELQKAHYNQLHRRVLELRQKLPTRTDRPSLLQDLKQDLASKMTRADALSKKVQVLRDEIKYTDEQHWGLRFHIEQLERSGEQPVLAQKLRVYSDALVSLVTMGHDIATMQEDVEWAEVIQADMSIKRLIRTIIRNDCEIEKCQQLKIHYAQIELKQKRNREKLDELLANFPSNMQ